MAESKKESLGAGDILKRPQNKKQSFSSKKNVKKTDSSPRHKPSVNNKEAKLLKLAEIGKKAHIVRKESNKNTYINIEQFFTDRNIESKYFIPFRIYMKHRTYQHSFEDFDKWFEKYLHRFD